MQAQYNNQRMTLFLKIPDTRMNVAGINLDPVKAALGRSLEDILRGLTSTQPVLEGGVYQARLTLAPSESVSLDLGNAGQLALKNDQGQLMLSVPAPLMPFVKQGLEPHISHGPTLRLSGPMTLGDFWLDSAPKNLFAFKVPVLGEVSLQLI